MASLAETLGTDILHKSDLQRTATGDLATISGLENLRIALFHRLVTVPGSLVMRPNYGVGVKLYQNAPATLTNQRKLALDIQANLIQDDRVESVESVRFEVDDLTPEKSKIIVKIKVAGLGETEMTFTPFGEGT